MTLKAFGYQVLPDFDRFSWQKFAGQSDQNVTYVYLTRSPLSRVRGQSPVLYIGKTEQAIAKRVTDETQNRNTSGNTQNTNIRLSAVIALLQGAGNAVETYFTAGLSFQLVGQDINVVSKILEVWDKRFFKEKFKVNNGVVDLHIEKFLLAHYAAVHWELPPLNNSM